MKWSNWEQIAVSNKLDFFWSSLSWKQILSTLISHSLYTLNRSLLLLLSHQVVSSPPGIPWAAAARLLCPWGSPGKKTSGLPFPSPGDLPGPRTELTSPALAGRFFTTEPPGKPTQEFRSILSENPRQSVPSFCKNFPLPLMCFYFLDYMTLNYSVQEGQRGSFVAESQRDSHRNELAFQQKVENVSSVFNQCDHTQTRTSFPHRYT